MILAQFAKYIQDRIRLGKRGFKANGEGRVLWMGRMGRMRSNIKGTGLRDREILSADNLK